MRKPLCAIYGCSRLAIYGPSDKCALVCIYHKRDDMIDMSAKKCLQCHKRPLYGNYQQEWLYCLDHRKFKMSQVSLNKLYFVDAKGRCREASEATHEELEAYNKLRGKQRASRAIKRDPNIPYVRPKKVKIIPFKLDPVPMDLFNLDYID